MKIKHKITIIIFLLALTTVLLTACQNNITGQWIRVENGNAEYSIIEFYEDGTYIADGLTGNYTISGNAVILQNAFAEPNAYGYEIRDGKLNLNGSVYVRQEDYLDYLDEMLSFD